MFTRAFRGVCGVETSADGPNCDRLKKNLGTEVLGDKTPWQ